MALIANAERSTIVSVLLAEGPLLAAIRTTRKPREFGSAGWKKPPKLALVSTN